VPKQPRYYGTYLSLQKAIFSVFFFLWPDFKITLTSTLALSRVLNLVCVICIQTKGYSISVLIIYRGHWTCLCVGVKKNCYDQWNCLICWFELFFLVIWSDLGVQCVIGFGRLWEFKRTNGNGWRGPLFAMFSRIELHNFSGQWDCWICWSESVFLVYFLVLDPRLKALGLI
jgi:hypothetical protein